MNGLEKIISHVPFLKKPRRLLSTRTRTQAKRKTWAAGRTVNKKDVVMGLTRARRTEEPTLTGDARRAGSRSEQRGSGNTPGEGYLHRDLPCHCRRHL